MSGDPRATGLSVNGWNSDYLESQHEAFKRDPSSVPADIRAFFQGYELAAGDAGGGMPAGSGSSGVRIEAMVQAYRGRGHLAAKLDPFGRDRDRPAALDLTQFGVTDEARNLPAPSEIGGTLSEYIDRLERIYLGSVGVEFMHIEDYEERDWLIRTWESLEGRPELPKPQRVHVLELLLNSEAFEAFLQKRYPGEKRFSLEGAESLIPLLDEVLDALSGDGADEVVLGMAHRGRLNVLNQILGKTPEQIFTEFEDTWADDAYMDEGGDVKYHRGYSASRQCASGRIIHLAMASNPSHLEAVNPVVLGRARAKQRLRGDGERSKVVPILIHGDAAIAGQGIVAECLNFSQLDGYKVGGTIHVVVNNNIGFTTRPEDARSTTYCTDIAKGFGCPVFHVNGEDPEAVVTVAKLAAQYRQRYQKDVFIDMWCYRRYGHNEQDEQSFTQPLLARRIKGRESVLGSYADRLVSEQVLTTHDRDVLRERVETMLDAAQQTARSTPRDPTIDPGSARWSGFEHGYSHEVADTSVSEDLLREVCGALGSVPDGFKVNPKLKKLLEQRGGLAEGGSVSHADGEILAFGTLLAEGHDVRVSGQDCRRGTFSSRHAVLYDHETGDAFEPLNNIREMGTFGTDTPPGSPTDDGHPRQGKLCIYDSPLSEASVLGFDYGYSLADPSMLVCWEAQFGDFTNGAQVIIDQFIASAQVKWERWSGLTMLLPHGYEGAGPEHSSARLERFLELCGNDNMQVVHPTTGAQIFHLLRRQVHRSFRKPLIVMTPKSLLRAPTSDVSELLEGGFQELIDDPRHADGSDTAGVNELVFCSGKLYHELAARRDEIGKSGTAIIRIEQLYPFHADLARDIIARYPEDAEIVWVQEEPKNMGAYGHMAACFAEHLGIGSLRYIGRDRSASPSAGSKKKDRAQQAAIIERAIGGAESIKEEPSRAAG